MASFLVIPAIDLMSGRVVRLRQGRREDSTFFSDDPAKVAREFEAAGAVRIHVVDLDGAFAGAPENLAAIRAIRQAVGCEMQLGGGLRTVEAIEQAIATGINYVILGTMAVEQPAVVSELVARHAGRVFVAIDARNGMIATHGWQTEQSQLGAAKFARHMIELGVRTFLYTDIARDGTLTGPNVEAVRAMATSIPAAIIASGGICSLDDLRALANLKLPNLVGAVVGRALYEGHVGLAEAITLLQSY